MFHHNTDHKYSWNQVRSFSHESLAASTRYLVPILLENVSSTGVGMEGVGLAMPGQLRGCYPGIGRRRIYVIFTEKANDRTGDVLGALPGAGGVALGSGPL